MKFKIIDILYVKFIWNELKYTFYENFWKDLNTQEFSAETFFLLFFTLPNVMKLKSPAVREECIFDKLSVVFSSKLERKCKWGY